MEASGDKEYRANIEQPLDLLALYTTRAAPPHNNGACRDPPEKEYGQLNWGGALKPTSGEMADDHIVGTR